MWVQCVCVCVCVCVCWSDGKCMLVYTSVNVYVHRYACA